MGKNCSGHVVGLLVDDRHPCRYPKPESSGLLTALRRVSGGEFAELTLMALLRNRGLLPCAGMLLPTAQVGRVSGREFAELA